MHRERQPMPRRVHKPVLLSPRGSHLLGLTAFLIASLLVTFEAESIAARGSSPTGREGVALGNFNLFLPADAGEITDSARTAFIDDRDALPNGRATAPASQSQQSDATGNSNATKVGPGNSSNRSRRKEARPRGRIANAATKPGAPRPARPNLANERTLYVVGYAHL